LGVLRKVHLAFDPLQVLVGPGVQPLRRAPSVAQQELAQAMPGAQLITLGRPARAHQVPQRLVRRIRHPHGRKVPGAVTARQLLGIAPVGLDPIPGLHRHQRRGTTSHFTPNCVSCQYST